MDQTCILCLSRNIRLVDEIDYSVLKGRYRLDFGINLDLCLDSPFDGKEIQLLECDSCGLQFFSPALPGNEELYRILAKNAWYYGDAKWEFQVAVERLKKMNAVLEIGCGSGRFLSMLAVEPSLDRDIVGLEFSSKAAADARGFGFSVQEMSIETFAEDPINQGRFDAVCTFQVLEHVKNPKSFLENALKCLRPGGLLIVSVPNREGVFRCTINHILDMPPHHVSRWSVETMKSVADLFHLTQSFLALEPIAEYHKASCRQVILSSRIGKLLGIHPRAVEPKWSIGYLILKALVRLTDKLIPESAWNYERYLGHTFCVGFVKSGE